ncbi:uncharacterized protein LOC130974517 [Arachis stenosperma]|uniref:uncharacterized protein LOC130974517 n=1 Tax=Arachis stenosperma TaxID=217475 RepID=UPI0025AD1531|nr:uncharacterized protein LOC130974517 [Arachis stenosperma]
MVNKYCIEALDRTMRDLLRFKNIHIEEQPFGGKTIVCTILKLTRNMHVQADDANVHSSQLKDFVEWILSIGDSKCGESKDGIDTIQIPDDIMIKEWDDPIAAICRAIYLEMFWPSNSVYEVKD